MSQTTYITTHNGNVITFDDIRPAMLKASEIAWHLARTCRYAGLMLNWYSNAEHSILGMQYCHTLNARRRFLIHDASEMITGDVPSPFKRRCPDYQAMCDMVQNQIDMLLCGSLAPAEIKEEIHYADLRVTAAEQKFIRHMDRTSYVATPPETFQYHNWDWVEAYHHWLLTFKQLFPDWRY
jgi:hypothetical protein